MTRTLDINEVQNRLPGILSSAREGDEIIIEDQGRPLAKVLPLTRPKLSKRRTAGLGKGKTRLGDSFDDQLTGQF